MKHRPIRGYFYWGYSGVSLRHLPGVLFLTMVPSLSPRTKHLLATAAWKTQLEIIIAHLQPDPKGATAVVDFPSGARKDIENNADQVPYVQFLNDSGGTIAEIIGPPEPVVPRRGWRRLFGNGGSGSDGSGSDGFPWSESELEKLDLHGWKLENDINFRRDFPENCQEEAVVETVGLLVELGVVSSADGIGFNLF